MKKGDQARTVVSLDSRRRSSARTLMHGQEGIGGQVLAFPAKRVDQCRPRIRRNALAFLPFLNCGSSPLNIDGHRRERFPAVKNIVKRAHASQYAPDGLSDQGPTMIPMTTIAPMRTISPMGRGTTPVRFRADMAKRLSSARIVAGFQTKKQAADALGIGLDRYEKWESGRTPIPAQYVAPVCALFSIDANYLFGIEPPAAARKAV